MRDLRSLMVPQRLDDAEHFLKRDKAAAMADLVLVNGRANHKTPILMELQLASFYQTAGPITTQNGPLTP